MKTLIIASLAVCCFASIAEARRPEPRNDTPRALACMKKHGFTYAQWRAYSVPADKVQFYRLCRDGA